MVDEGTGTFEPKLVPPFPFFFVPFGGIRFRVASMRGAPRRPEANLPAAGVAYRLPGPLWEVTVRVAQDGRLCIIGA
jgi:hypothetical protein